MTGVRTIIGVNKEGGNYYNGWRNDYPIRTLFIWNLFRHVPLNFPVGCVEILMDHGFKLIVNDPVNLSHI